MLGLSLIVKNEQENLTKNLLNFCNEFDYVVVIDTGSTDGTKEILQQNWIDYLSYNLDKNDKCSLIKARNFSIASNREDWVLVMDADETLTKEGIQNMKKILETSRQDIDGFFIKFLDYRFWDPFEDYKLCLLRKNRFFEWYVHANPQSFFRKNNLHAEYIHEIVIEHYPTTFSKEKIDLYINQMLFWLEKERNNSRYLWFLWYSFYKNKNLTEAKFFLEQSLNLLSKEYPVETLNAWLVLSVILLKEANYKIARKMVNNTLAFYEKEKNDFEVKINFRLKETLLELKRAIRNKNTQYEVYSFMY